MSDLTNETREQLLDRLFVIQALLDATMGITENDVKNLAIAKKVAGGDITGESKARSAAKDDFKIKAIVNALRQGRGHTF
jgi:hypothetical protein